MKTLLIGLLLSASAYAEFQPSCERWEEQSSWRYGKIEAMLTCKLENQEKETGCFVIGYYDDDGERAISFNTRSDDGIGGWVYFADRFDGNILDFEMVEKNRGVLLDRWHTRVELNGKKVEDNLWNLTLKPYRKERGLFRRWELDGTYKYTCTDYLN